jgi:hypothetical protein
MRDGSDHRAYRVLHYANPTGNFMPYVKNGSLAEGTAGVGACPIGVWGFTIGAFAEKHATSAICFHSASERELWKQAFRVQQLAP